MNPRCLISITGACLLGVAQLSAQNAEPKDAAAAPAITPASQPAANPMQPVIDVVSKIKVELQAGKRTEAELASLIAEFDKIIESAADTNPELAASAVRAKGTLYQQVLRDQKKGDEILALLAEKFGSTMVAKDHAAVVEKMKKAEAERAEAKKNKEAVVGKAAPNITFKPGSPEGWKSLSDLKGKVVIVDFFATWCGPCIRSFPNLRELAAHYKGYDVVVLGVTSIQGRISNLEAKPIDCSGDEAKEITLFGEFCKKHDVTWPMLFSEQTVFNKDYGVTGIPHVAIIAPDGTVRANGLHPSSPLSEKSAKIDAILREFNLRTPAPAEAASPTQQPAS